MKQSLKWLTRRVRATRNRRVRSRALALDAVCVPKSPLEQTINPKLTPHLEATRFQDLNPYLSLEMVFHNGDRQRTELALRQSEERFRRLANNVTQFIWMSEGSGPVWYNQRWGEYTGLTVEEMQAEGWRAAVHPTQVDEVTKLETHQLETAEPWERVIALRRRDGVYRSFLLRAIATRDPDSGVVHWFCTSTDIDAQLKAEEELRRANLNLQQFASAAAHDLQEPLRNVALGLELLKRLHGDQLCEAAAALADECIEGSQRMHTMVQDLLAFTRVDELNEGEIPSIDAAEVLLEVLRNLRTSVRETKAEIVCSDLPSVKMRSAHFLQLMQNLIGNGLKYRHSERTPRISIRAARRADRWVFAVEDNGIGFDAVYGERIFGMFKRLHPKNEYPGSGIGLATCARIVNSYNGRIWAEGELGLGACFFFTIPD